MGLRRLTALALAHTAGTALLLASAPDLGAEAATGDAGAALLLASGSAAVLAGARTALAVHLVHLGRACRTVGLTAAPVHAAALRAAPRARRPLIAAAVGGSLSLVALTSPSLAAADSPAWPLTPDPSSADAHEAARPLPEEPPDSGHSAAHPGGQDRDVHIAARGESLWRSVAADLPGATTARLADRIGEIHAANRAKIGDDANLLLPGQRLEMA